MGSLIPIDRETKIMLLQVLKRGGWTTEDVRKLPDMRVIRRTETNTELLEEFEWLLEAQENVTIDESKAKELAKAGHLNFTGKYRMLTEWAEQVRAGKK